MDAADTPQPGEVSQHKAQITAWFALAAYKLWAAAAAGGPWLSTRLLSRASGSSGTVAQALPFSGGPPSVGRGEYILDVIVDQHNVKVVAFFPVVVGQLWIDFPANPVVGLLLAQENEVVEFGGIVAVRIGR
jgi:hypothetical protein